MGTCQSSRISALENAEVTNARPLPRPRRIQATGTEREVTILLIGSCASGKTTIMKQMRLCHGEPFTESERKARITAIYDNIFAGVAQLLDIIDTTELKISDGIRKDVDLLITCKDVYFPSGIPVRLIEAVGRIWADPIIMEAYEQRSNFKIDDSVPYFFEEIERIGSMEYLPSDEDMLRVRVQTLGVQQYEYRYKNTLFLAVDVPGQHSPQKWIRCFDGVNAVLFVVAISEFDQRDDKGKNKVQESFELFKDCINNQYLVNSHPIVFLNKIDVFKDKIAKVSLNDHFKEYAGPDKKCRPALEFFTKEFQRRCNNSTQRRMFMHKSCATDTTKFHQILESAADAVMAKAFAEVGLM